MISLIFFTLHSSLFTSCADLEQDPVSSISTDTFYSTEAELTVAVNGIGVKDSQGDISMKMGSMVSSTTRVSISVTFRPIM